MNNGSAVGDVLQLVELTVLVWGMVLSGEVRDRLNRSTFTWTLIGRGMPSFSSLVFSLKSLQNCAMGIPFWIWKRRRKKHLKKNKGSERVDLKCMSSQIIQLNFTGVTLCCQNTDAWAAVSQSNLPTFWQRSHTTGSGVELVCAWGPLFSPASRLSRELWLNACWSPEPEEPGDEWAPIFWLLQGRAEREQNGWVTLSQHPGQRCSFLQRFSLEMNSVAKTNKESN